MYYLLFKGLALGDSFDEAQGPKPFRLLKIGDNELTLDGEKFKLNFTKEQLQKIVDYQKEKGEKIAIDSRHALLEVAKKAHVDESEALKAVPGKVAALGFCDLELQEEGLYACNVELLPLAKTLMREGCLRYYSPTIRGLGDDEQLRISSIAFDNVPALNNLDILAASAERDNNPTRKVQKMNKLEVALRKLLGDEALALSDSTNDSIAQRVETIATELPSLRQAKAEVATLALAAENSEKEQLLKDALAAKKITQGSLETLKKADVEWLKEYLGQLPENSSGVPEEKLEAKADSSPTVALSDDEEKLCKRMGITEEEFLKAKKEHETEEE